MRKLFLIALVLLISFFSNQVSGQQLSEIQFVSGSQVEILGTGTATLNVSTALTTGGNIHIYAKSTGTGIYIASSTNRVGIGTTNPLAPFHVSTDQPNVARFENAGIPLEIVISDESLATGYPGVVGSYGSGAGVAFVKYGAADSDWGEIIYNAAGTIGFGGGSLANVNSASFSTAITVGYPAVSTDAARKDYVDNNFALASGSSGVWKLSGNNLYASSTSYNVAIGTSTPAGKLHVVGIGYSDQNAGLDSATNPTTTTAGGLILDGGYSNGFYRTRLVKIDRTGNLPLYIQGSTGSTAFSNIARFGGHSYSTNIFEVFGNTAISGSVAIGASVASSTLWVNGDITANGGEIIFADAGTSNREYITSNDSGITGINAAGVFGFYADATLGAAITSPSAGISVNGIYSSGNIGIGTTTTTQSLTINGGDIDFIRGDTSAIHSLGSISFDWTQGTYDTPTLHGIESRDEAGAFAGHVRINSYGDLIATIDSNANSTSYFKVERESNSGNGTDVFVVDENGSSTFSGTVGVGYPTGASHAATKSYVDLVSAANWTQSGSYLYPSSTSWSVGIGTTAPAATLEVSHATFATLRLSGGQSGAGGGASALQLFAPSSPSAANNKNFAFNNINGSASGQNSLTLQSRNDDGSFKANLLGIQNDGNVGIGTTTPITLLQLVNATAPSILSTWTDTGGLAEFKAGEGATFMGSIGFFGSNYSTALWRNAAMLTAANNDLGNVIFRTKTGGTYYERMFIANSGNVGIGTTAPMQKLAVTGNIHAGTVKSTYLGSAFTAAAGWKHSLLGQTYFDGTNFITPQIGSNSVAAVVSDTDGVSFFTTANTGAVDRTDSPATFATYERMRINAAGNVGIGTASPGAYKLNVQAGAAQNLFESTIDAQIALKSSDTWSGILFDDSGSTNDYIWYNGVNGTFAFGGGGSNVANKKLHVDGGVTIGANYDATAIAANSLSVEGNLSVGGSFSPGSISTGGGTFSASVAASDSGVVNITNTNVTGTVGTSTALRIFGADFGNYSGTGYYTIGAHITGGDTFGANHKSYAIYAQTGSGSGSEYAAYFGGSVGINTLTPGYALDVVGDISANGWLRTTGATGWYSDTYGGGWHMTDATWIRSYNSKSVYVDALLRADGGIVSGGASSQGAGTILATGNIYMNNQTTFGLKGNSVYGDTINTGTTNDPLEINYYTAGPTKICASANCATVSANFDTSGNVQIGNGTYSSGALLSIGSASVDYPADSGWASTWNSNILLSGLNSTSISFHDASARVDKIRATGGMFYIGENAGWGAASVTIGGDLTVSGGDLTVAKLNADTVDPPYTIGGKKYATYMAGMTGLKEETSGVVKLKDSKATLDLLNFEEGSDLWLFAKTTNLENKGLDGLIVILTPNFKGDVWYEKIDNKLIIRSSEKSGEVSYRLTAPRFDHETNGSNRRTDFGSDGNPNPEGLNLDKLIK